MQPFLHTLNKLLFLLVSRILGADSEPGDDAPLWLGRLGARVHGLFQFLTPAYLGSDLPLCFYRRYVFTIGFCEFFCSLGIFSLVSGSGAVQRV